MSERSEKMNTKINHKKWYVFIIALLLSILFVDISLASNIEIIGSDNPKITTGQGVDVTDKNELDRYQYYNVNYSWKVPNNVTIHAGDTATFTVPNTVQVLYDTTFPVYDNEHHQVGEFTVKAGAKTGTLIFNDYFASHHIDQNIHGTLTFTGVGKKTYENKGWVINKNGWFDEHNQPTWDIVYNPEQKHLVEVTIHDELEGDQTLDPASIEIQYGTVDQNNQFHKEGILLPDCYQLKTTNHSFTLKIPTLNTAIQIVYHSQLSTSEDAIINNTVTGSDKTIGIHQDTASIQVDGNGSASGNITPSETNQSNSVQTVIASYEASTESTSESIPSSTESTTTSNSTESTLKDILFNIESTTMSNSIESTSENLTSNTENTIIKGQRLSSNSSEIKSTSTSQRKEAQKHQILPQTSNRYQWSLTLSGLFIVVVIILILYKTRTKNMKK